MIEFALMAQQHSEEKKLAMQWKRAGPFLVAERRKDIRRKRNSLSMDHLNSLFLEAIKNKRRSRTSGFVDMYLVLRRSQG